MANKTGSGSTTTKTKAKTVLPSGSTPPPVLPTSPTVSGPRPAATSKTVAPQPSATGQKITAQQPKPTTKAANQVTHNPRANQQPAVQHPTQQQPSVQPQQQAPQPGWGGDGGDTRNKAGSVPQGPAPQYTGPSWGQTPERQVLPTTRPVMGVAPYQGPSWGNTQPLGTQTRLYNGPGWANTQPDGTKPVPYQGPSWGNTQPANTQTIVYQGPSWGNTQKTWTRADFEAWRAGERGDPGAWDGVGRQPIPLGLGNSGNMTRNPHWQPQAVEGFAAPELADNTVTYPEGYTDPAAQGYTDYFPGAGGYSDPWQDWGGGGGGWGSRPWYDYGQQVEDWFPGMMNWRF